VLDEPPQSFEEHLRWRYGARGSEVAAVSRAQEALRERIVADLPDLAAEVAYAVDHEMAMTLRDVLERRLGVHLRSRHRDKAMAQRVAGLMAARLGWDEARTGDEVARYVADVAESVTALTDDDRSA
jgi:glycerol-3-phosphate dehydrogenase